MVSYYASITRKIIAQFGKCLLARMANHITGTSGQIISEYDFDENIFSKVNRLPVHFGFDLNRFLCDYDKTYDEIC